MCFTTAENGHCRRAEDAAIAVHERATSSDQLTTLRLAPQLLDLSGVMVDFVDLSLGFMVDFVDLFFGFDG